MTIIEMEKINQIHKKTAYPDSISVRDGMYQVWNECEQKYRNYKKINVESIIKEIKDRIEKCEVDIDDENFKIINDSYKKALYDLLEFID